MQLLEESLKRYWGYDRFLPLQREAMGAVLAGRDSVVVLPTGGGKSLCFQVPAVMMEGLAIVVSPLISLMKDQVDALTECGVPAARIDSTLDAQERSDVAAQVRDGSLKLIYVAPERLLSERFLEFIQEANVSFIAVDEAHCVSMWGHDFRPEYRRLGELKQLFPGVAIHTYTATATGQVREDIAVQLGLEAPEVLIGSFDRPNLIYKVERRGNKLEQVREVIDRHAGESGIIYCIRRADVDDLSGKLAAKGYRALPYHAGMDPEARKANQEAFITEQVDVIVATVAFGMGIDKSNVRYVIHTGMPKSVEHYQQESGRAGRDGLEAECCLFYSGGDYGTWGRIMREMEPEPKQIALGKLNEMQAYSGGVTCRHRALVRYFGQDLEKENCEACDVCLGGLDGMDDALVTAQKILSCVVRLDERFGGDYTASVLVGSREQRVLDNRHDELSTHGLLSDFAKRVVRDWIEQLVAQDCLGKSGEYAVLTLTPTGRDLLKGDGQVHLLKPPAKKARASKVASASWEGVDRDLFERLRTLRREIALTKGVPAFVVFGDASLRDMARSQPTTAEQFLVVHGVGQKKREQYGAPFLEAIQAHLADRQPGRFAAEDAEDAGG